MRKSRFFQSTNVKKCNLKCDKNLKEQKYDVIKINALHIIAPYV